MRLFLCLAAAASVVLLAACGASDSDGPGSVKVHMGGLIGSYGFVGSQSH